MPPPPLVSLVLVVLLTAAPSRGDGGPKQPRPVREPAFTVNMTDLELLLHVLQNETQWRLVLKESVKGIDVAPPYEQRFPGVMPWSVAQVSYAEGAQNSAAEGATKSASKGDAPSKDDPLKDAHPKDAHSKDAHSKDASSKDASESQVVDPALREYEPLSVVYKVMTAFTKVGSFVAFAARVVHRAVACFAARHLAFQMEYLWQLLAREAEPALVLAELTALRTVVARVVDKLALAPGAAELDLALDAYWDVVALMQEDAVHHVLPTVYPPHTLVIVGMLHGELAAYVNGHCAWPYRAEHELFADAGFDPTDELLLDGVLGATVPTDRLVAAGRRHAAFLARYVYDLDATVMPTSLWTQLFYYAPRLMPADPRDHVNPSITRMPDGPAGLHAPAVAVNTTAEQRLMRTAS